MGVRISPDEYEKLFAEVTFKAHERMMQGYEKYGEVLKTDFDFVSEAEEEIADAINYLVMGLFKFRLVKKILEESVAYIRGG